MSKSDDYRATVRKIGASGILGNEHYTEVFEIYGGFVSRDVLERLG